MSVNYVGKNSLSRFLEKLYETFSKKGHAHSKADILDFPIIPEATVESVNGKTGVVIINEIPSCSTSNNGQFLRVVNGFASWSTVHNAEEASF